MDNFMREDPIEEPCVSTTYDTTYNTTYETIHPNNISNNIPNHNIHHGNNVPFLIPFHRYNEYGERRDVVKRFFARVVGANYIPPLEPESINNENVHNYNVHGVTNRFHHPNCNINQVHQPSTSYVVQDSNNVNASTTSTDKTQLLTSDSNINQNANSTDDESEIIQNNQVNTNYNRQIISIMSDTNFDNPPLSIFDKNYFLYIPRTPEGISEEPMKNNKNDPITQMKINKYLHELQYRNLCLTYSIVKDQYQLLLYRQNINNSSTIPIQFYSIDLNNCMTFKSMVESLLDLNTSYEYLFNNDLETRYSSTAYNKHRKSFTYNCIDALISDDEFFTVTLCKLLLLVEKYDTEFYHGQAQKFKDVALTTNIRLIDIIELIFNGYPLPSQFRKILNNDQEYHFQFENLDKDKIFIIKKLPLDFERRDLDEILFWYCIRHNFNFIDEITKFLNDVIDKNIDFFHRKNVKCDLLLEQFCDLKIDVGILYCVRKIISPDNISNSKAIFSNVLYYFKYKISRVNITCSNPHLNRKDLGNYLRAVRNLNFYNKENSTNLNTSNNHQNNVQDQTIFRQNDVYNQQEQIRNRISRQISNQNIEIINTPPSLIELSTSDDEISK